ncbi:F0F1 ATP synthase subunit delta [Microbacterium sp. SORGH_AS_0888]|uniref:F0F1 ATP synthase subunit delta n=1 Tax=Microbacterium sp. SORGH_AS_0888 TaxID=3041791 RepID=UPI00278A31A3|nr:F0F1 ATP synthase subunit delta [Microbacterium sp. SORGH_AS_0888]MDQ1127999.1 F-type H+-transporting ATPase subunit delta [Microbacterium sp. SORGH_AS_0888]
MGSATTQALGAVREVLDRTDGVDLTTAAGLFQAARAIDGTSQLRGALSDSAAAPEARRKVVADVFRAALTPAALALLETAVEHRWSSADGLVDGIEELAVRAASIGAAGVDLESELFQVSRLVSANPELELALGSRIGDADAKSALISSILGGRFSEATVLIVSSLVRHPRERRVRGLLGRAMAVTADQRGRTVATVTAASPLSDAQKDRLVAALSARYGVQVTLNLVVDPALVGGVRVQVADDLIDASVSTRIADLRQRLAG